jgi:hypothetical protein
MRRKIRNEGMYITPQRVYGTVEGAACRECGFCVNKKDTGLIGSNAFYCTRFYPHENPKARINAYDKACGKFERKGEP